MIGSGELLAKRKPNDVKRNGKTSQEGVIKRRKALKREEERKEKRNS